MRSWALDRLRPLVFYREAGGPHSWAAAGLPVNHCRHVLKQRRFTKCLYELCAMAPDGTYSYSRFLIGRSPTAHLYLASDHQLVTNRTGALAYEQKTSPFGLLNLEHLRQRVPDGYHMAVRVTPRDGGAVVSVDDSAPALGVTVAHGGRPTLSSAIPEWSPDGRHCYAIPKQAWIDRLHKLGWGYRSLRHASALLRSLRSLPEGRLQFIPPTCIQAIASAVIAVAQQYPGGFRVYSFVIFPDDVRMMPGTIIGIPWSNKRVLLSDYPDAAEVPAHWLGSGISPVDPPQLVGLEIASSDMPTPCPLMHHLWNEDQKVPAWLADPEEAAAYVALQMATAGLPTA